PINNSFFFFNDTATTEIYTLSLHDALPISGRLFGVTQPLRHRLKQLPADRRVPLDQGTEVPVGEAPANELAGRGYRRRASASVDQRDLAEVVALLQLRARLPAQRHRRLSGVDQEERCSAGALLGDRLAVGEAPLLEEARDLP